MKKRYIIGGVIGLLMITWVVLVFFDWYKTKNMIYGTTFDPKYAGFLKLDPEKVFSTIVSEWNFKHLRIPAHWDKLEKERGKFDFTELDYYLNESQKAGAKVMLAIGNKTPRWPECHTPEWAKKLPDEEFMPILRNYMAEVAKRYKDHPAIESWQVENEPFLFYGTCRKLTREQLKQEVGLVKEIDNVHPILVADSGELSFWSGTGTVGDLFGTTLYRVVWNKYIGYWSYDWLPAAFYRLKFWWIDRVPENSYVVELQAEPWATDSELTEMPIKNQYKSMDLKRLKKNIEFSNRVGVSRVYLWGSEWWYWLKQNGYNEIPDHIGKINSSTQIGNR